MTSSATVPGSGRRRRTRRHRAAGGLRLDEAGRAAFEAGFTETWGGSTRGSGPGIVVPNTYLQVTGVRV